MTPNELVRNHSWTLVDGEQIIDLPNIMGNQKFGRKKVYKKGISQRKNQGLVVVANLPHLLIRNL